ncbi:MAG: hypothetical protein WCS52_15675 [bacterium]
MNATERLQLLDKINAIHASRQAAPPSVSEPPPLMKPRSGTLQKGAAAPRHVHARKH